MKHLVLTLGTAAFLSATGFAQADCAADFDFMGASFGLSPNPALGESFVDGVVGQPYEEVIHVLTPSMTSDIPDLPIDLPVPLPVDSVTLDGISLVGESGEEISLEELGLSLTANNAGDSGNEFTFLGGGQYCAVLAGVPDSAGFFVASLDVTGHVLVSFGPTSTPVSYPFEFQGFSLTVLTPGCMDELACNYDPEATSDDGSCTYPEPLLDCNGDCLYDPDEDGICNDVEGCTDETACNYDPFATVDDDSCLEWDACGECGGTGVLGCTDELACNFEPTATCDDNLCVYAEAYYTCDGICINDEDGDFICDELEVVGCQDETACNYDPEATDEGDCEFAEEYYNCDGSCINDEDGDFICDELEVEGCMDPLSCTFDNFATEMDTSCAYPGEPCDDDDATTNNDAYDEECECVGEPVVSLNDSKLQNVEVYPNPAADVLNVLLPVGQTHRVALWSSTGQAVWTSGMALSGRVILDVSDLPAGAYLLHVSNDRTRQVRQVMLGVR